MRTLTQRFEKDVNSTQEYRDAVAHADALGFHVEEVEAFGGWETADRHPVFLHRASDLEVETAGRKYFHVPVDGETTRVQPVATRTKERGHLRVTFRREGR